jgi:hypothetical protein
MSLQEDSGVAMADEYENNRWSAHLEYLKVAIALSTATLAVAAAVYSDPAKVPTDSSKNVLFACAAAVLVTLIMSVFAIISVANRVADKTAKASTFLITFWSGLSFFALIVSGALLLYFFGLRTLSVTSGPQQAIDAGLAIVEKQGIKANNETVTLASLEAKADKYYLTFKVEPTAKTAAVVYDPKTNSVISLSLKP